MNAAILIRLIFAFPALLRFIGAMMLLAILLYAIGAAHAGPPYSSSTTPPYTGSHSSSQTTPHYTGPSTGPYSSPSYTGPMFAPTLPYDRMPPTGGWSGWSEEWGPMPLPEPRFDIPLPNEIKPYINELRMLDRDKKLDRIIQNLALALTYLQQCEGRNKVDGDLISFMKVVMAYLNYREQNPEAGEATINGYGDDASRALARMGRDKFCAFMRPKVAELKVDRLIDPPSSKPIPLPSKPERSIPQVLRNVAFLLIYLKQCEGLPEANHELNLIVSALLMNRPDNKAALDYVGITAHNAQLKLGNEKFCAILRPAMAELKKARPSLFLSRLERGGVESYAILPQSMPALSAVKIPPLEMSASIEPPSETPSIEPPAKAAPSMETPSMAVPQAPVRPHIEE